MKPLKIRVNSTSAFFRMPKYAHHGDAGLDLLSIDEIALLPGERKKIPLGFSMELPEGYLGAIAPRSGLAMKHGIGLVNSWGVIDSTYRGEICAILINMGEKRVLLPRHTRIAQLIVIPVAKVSLQLVEEILNETDRGAGGFGSSGL